MKLIFICGSLEPGRDGVGDYTRRLAGELIRQGQEVKILALNDKAKIRKPETGNLKLDSSALGKVSDLKPQISSFTECQESEGTEVECLRLPQTLAWNERIVLARQWVEAFNPDWMSLQFVPFGFHPKGLCFGLGKRLKAVAPHAKWHVMFHELWLGEKRGALWKERISGFCQRGIIGRLIVGLHPTSTHTHTLIYRDILRHYGFACELLPLISNIPRKKAAASSFQDLIPALIKETRTTCIIGTLFGSFYHQSWDLQGLLRPLAKQAEKNGKKVIIVSLGHMSAGKECWEKLPEQFPEIHFIALGPQDVSFISYWLAEFTDFGVVTTPGALAGKSGSYMAFKEHGVPVFCSAQPVELKFSHVTVLEDGLTPVSEKQSCVVIPARRPPVDTLQTTTGQFLQALRSIHP